MRIFEAGKGCVTQESVAEQPPREMSRHPESTPLRVLFLPNWRVNRTDTDDPELQSPDFTSSGRPYWFFRHFLHSVEVDVLDVAQWRFHRWEDRYLHFYAVQGARAVLLGRRHDLVLAHGAQAGVIACSLLGLIPHRPGLMVIDVGCLNGGRPERRVQFQTTRMALRNCDAIVWHARASRELCLSRCPELAEKGRFVAFGVDTDGLASIKCEDGDYAICVGYSQRDWPLLFEAWRLLAADRKLVLLGASGIAAPADANITVIPKVPFRQYLEAVARSRMVVLPLPDGWGSWGQMTLLQCMALGKPVVVTDVRPVRDYTATGCRRVEPSNPRLLAATVDELWADEQARADLGTLAAGVVRQRFSEVEMAKRLECMIGSVAGRW